MLTELENTRISKFLSLVLRHRPELIGITLDEAGWTVIQVLITQAQKRDMYLTFDTIKYVVDTNNKKRFSFSEDFTKIRASQGHSIAVTLNYTPKVPPDILYHGTNTPSVNAIFQDGLKKMQRHHVHLSTDLETAIKVGQRRGKAVVLEIASGEMAKNGYIFYLSDNGVWLTDLVPPAYISIRQAKK